MSASIVTDHALTATARRDALDVLSRLATAVGADLSFGARDWATSRAAPSYRNLLSTADLQQLLGLRIIRCQHALLVRDSAVTPISEFTTTFTVGDSVVRGCVVPELFWQLHADGATAHFRGVHHWHRGCRDLAQALADVAGLPVRAVAFLTPSRSSGLELHRDPDDLLVLQLEGHKTWELSAIGDGAVAETGSAASSLPPATEMVTLGPGGILAMRSTVAHRAATADEPSLHVTFGVSRN
jgi:hypothetical protein